MGLQIKKVLKSKGIQVSELADVLNINRVSLSQQINGNPTVETLEKISTALNVHISELFESKDELTALIKTKDGDYYNANSLDGLREVIEKIELKNASK